MKNIIKNLKELVGLNLLEELDNSFYGSVDVLDNTWITYENNIFKLWENKSNDGVGFGSKNTSKFFESKKINEIVEYINNRG